MDIAVYLIAQIITTPSCYLFVDKEKVKVAGEAVKNKCNNR